METLISSSASIVSSSSSPPSVSIISPKSRNRILRFSISSKSDKKEFGISPKSRNRILRFSISSKSDEKEFGIRSETNDARIVPVSSNQAFSKWEGPNVQPKIGSRDWVRRNFDPGTRPVVLRQTQGPFM